jgi:hypothetical protein
MSPRYVVKGKIGAGGLGEVYLANDTQLDRDVALKRVKAPESGSADALHADLIREARTLSSLQHPHIVTIYDVGQDEDGPFVVMELLKGETLDDVIERGAMTVADFKEVVVQSLEGMIAAQDMGLVHRDLKPSNLMLVWLPSGKFQIKILDFGLAKFSRTATRQTEDQESGIMGSIFFMAPEQFERLPLDGRTDMYSLGCIFYQIVTTHYPFDGKTGPEVMVSHLQHHVCHLAEARPDLPVWLADWVMWLISREMDERPADACTALEYFRQQKSGLKNPTSTTPTSATGVKMLGRGTGPGGVHGAAGKSTQPVRGAPTQRVGGPATQTLQGTTAASRSSRPAARKVAAKSRSGLYLTLAVLAAAGGGAAWWFTRPPATPPADPRAPLEALFASAAPAPDASTVNLLMSAVREGAADAPRAIATLKKLKGPQAAEAMASELGKATGAARLALVDVITTLPSKPGIAQLLKIASNETGPIRPAALEALGKIASPGEIPGLLKLLPKVKDAPTRNSLLTSLNALLACEKDRNARAGYLIDALAGSESSARPDLLHLLGQNGHPKADKALATELAAVGDRRQDALEALKDWPNPGPEITTALFAAANNSPGDRDALVTAYCQSAARSTAFNSAELTAALQKVQALATGTKSREALCAALASTASPEAAAYAKQLAADPPWSATASKAATAIAAALPNVMVLGKGENHLDSAKAIIMAAEKDAYYTSTSRYISNWKNPATRVAWDLSTPEAATVSVSVLQSTSSRSGRTFRVRLGLDSNEHPVQPTDTLETFTPVDAGSFQIPRAGTWRLWLEAARLGPGEPLFNVREVIVKLK